MNIAIIVEGKNDRARLRKLLTDEIDIFCTYGTPSSDKLDELKRKVIGCEVFLFTDNDASGKKIRGALRDMFPDAEQIYTRKSYAGVEGTPDDYLIERLEKAGLGEFIVRPSENPDV